MASSSIPNSMRITSNGIPLSKMYTIPKKFTPFRLETGIYRKIEELFTLPSCPLLFMVCKDMLYTMIRRRSIQFAFLHLVHNFLVTYSRDIRSWVTPPSWSLDDTFGFGSHLTRILALITFSPWTSASTLLASGHAWLVGVALITSSSWSLDRHLRLVFKSYYTPYPRLKVRPCSAPPVDSCHYLRSCWWLPTCTL